MFGRELIGWALLTTALSTLMCAVAGIIATSTGDEFVTVLHRVAASFGSTPDGQRFDPAVGFGFLTVMGTIVIALAAALGFRNDWSQFTDRARHTLNTVLFVGVFALVTVSAATLLNLVVGRAAVVDGLLLILGSWIVTTFWQLIAWQPPLGEQLERARARTTRLTQIAQQHGVVSGTAPAGPSRARSEWVFWGVPLAAAALLPGLGIWIDAPETDRVRFLIGFVCFLLFAVGMFQVSWRALASYVPIGWTDRAEWVVGWVFGAGLFVAAVWGLGVESGPWAQRGAVLVLLVISPILVPSGTPAIPVLRAMRARATLADLERAERWRDRLAERAATD